MATDCLVCEGFGYIEDEAIDSKGEFKKVTLRCPACLGKGEMSAAYERDNVQRKVYYCSECGSEQHKIKVLGIRYWGPGFCQCGAVPANQLPFQTWRGNAPSR